MREVYDIFHQYLKGYLRESPKANIIHARVEFKSNSTYKNSKLDSWIYVVPIRSQKLLKKEFGQLLREIIITLMLHLTQKKGLCLHSSSVGYKNKAALFIGPSGIGKSSICQMLSKKFIQLTDDATFLVKKKQWVTSPLPIFEKNVPLYLRTSAKKYEVRAFYFLNQSEKNSCCLVNGQSELFQLLVDSLIYTGSPHEISSITLLLSSNLPFYKLNFTKEGTIRDILETHFE